MDHIKQDKLRASLSLDLDNEWSYLKIQGNSRWESLPTYFPVFIPYVLELFKRLQLNVTFFIVGQDLTIPENIPYLKKIIEEGHSVANHSMNHESWLSAYSEEQLFHEVYETDSLIRKHLECKPIGFRGPGYSWNPKLIRILREQNYVYDSSVLPTFIGPIARWYYFKKSGLGREEQKKRKNFFGKFSDGFKKNKPFHLNGDGRKLIEIPVTTMPVFRLPFHLSYLIYMHGYSPFLMNTYLEIVIRLCKTFRIEPNFLIHPLDLIGGDQLASLDFFPGMDIDSNKKTKVFYKVITTLQTHFRLMSLDSYVLELIAEGRMTID
jgi:peptidoglycan-N-acetylglucosamine deacetylase